MTRKSASTQVKALSMIIAIEGLIPSKTTNHRRAVAAQNQPAPPPVNPPFYVSAWARTSEPSPDTAEEEIQQEAVTEVQSNPLPAGRMIHLRLPPARHLTLACLPLLSLEPLPSDLIASPPMPAFVPDSRIAFSIDKNRFGRRR
jgi:hypothetical protein